jgi:hypothetical protein
VLKFKKCREIIAGIQKVEKVKKLKKCKKMGPSPEPKTLEKKKLG